RVFERFYTDRPEGEDFGQNSGLGLSISRQIIEAHGGEIDVKNVISQEDGSISGACFEICLPLVE
ncbi:MAG: ATP-binding protein, partial [Lentilitoribacter sp.]